MQTNIGPIAKQWTDDDSRRQPRLSRLRKIATYTIPSVLPPQGQTEEMELPETFQSIGSRGIGNLEGKLLTAMFPAGTFWARLNASEAVKSDESAGEVVPSVYSGQPISRLQAFEEVLFLRELAVQNYLDSTNYRTAMRIAIRHLLVLGSSCMKILGSGRMMNFREDQYVLYRKPDGDLQYLITKEMVDPLSLGDEMVAKINVNSADLAGKSTYDRCTEMYTRCRRVGGGWKIEQEINGLLVLESDERVSPYIVGAYDLNSGEHYGRGFAENNVAGDLRSANGTYRGILSIVAIMARLLVILDDTAGTTKKRDIIEKPDGSVIFGRVVNGKAQDVGMLQADKMADLQGVMAAANRIEDRLAKAMLIESEVQPTGDRVTALQVARIAAELEGGLGGVYSAIAEQMQRPLLDRVLYDLGRTMRIAPLPDEAVTVQTLTGLEALSRQRDLQKLQFLMQTFSAAPEMLERLNLSNVAHQFIKLMEIDPRGLVKSEEQLQQERQAAQQAAIQQAAAGQAIKSLGTIAEQQAAAGQRAA